MQAEFSDVRWGCAPTRARLDALGQKLLQACCGCSDDDVHHPASADALAQRPHSDDAVADPAHDDDDDDEHDGSDCTTQPSEP